MGLTANTFKQRYGGHKGDFKNSEKRTSSTLSGHIWRLKDQVKDFEIDCFFLKVIKFRAGSYSFKCMVYHLINKHLGANNVFIMFGMDINAFPKG